MDDFNFNEWANLYKTHPEEFEHKRKELLEKEILKAPVAHRGKLRLLQMECDAYHESLSPLGATVAISQLMLQKSNQLKTGLESLKVSVDGFAIQMNKLEDK